MSSGLNPYLGFSGTARSAMEFYRSVFGGELTFSTYGEYSVGDASEAEKIMHSQLESPSGYVLMASDSPVWSGPAPAGSFSVSLSGDDAEELTGYWEKLSEGGVVAEPLTQAPWGDSFGSCTDVFGVSWMVNISGRTD